MPTFKPFTRAVAGALLATALTACVSLPGGGKPADMSSASVSTGNPDTIDRNAAGAVGGEITPLPAPDVPAGLAAEFAEAVVLMQQERLSDAEVLLLSITTQMPELAGPWINLGQIYVAQDRPEEARQAFESAAAANPYNCTAHNELGLLARVQGDFDAAERHYLSCLERVPDDGAALLNLGILYELYLGRLDEALASYRQYQSLLVEPDRRVQGWVMDLERRLGV